MSEALFFVLGFVVGSAAVVALGFMLLTRPLPSRPFDPYLPRPHGGIFECETCGGCS